MSAVLAIEHRPLDRAIAVEVVRVARVPLLTLIKHGEISLEALVARGDRAVYRIVTKGARGAPVYHEAVGPVAFLELGESLGLMPWGATDDEEDPNPVFECFAGPFDRDGFVEYIDGDFYDWERNTSNFDRAALRRA